MLELGLDPLAVNDKGKTAEQVAAELEKSDLERLLRARREAQTLRTEAEKNTYEATQKQKRKEERQRCIEEMDEFGIQQIPGYNRAWDLEDLIRRIKANTPQATLSSRSLN